MSEENVPYPTYEQCNEKASVVVDGKTIGFYTWYPQMGGYGSVCAVLTEKLAEQKEGFGHCFEALVWHDGEFPFSDMDECGRKPARIHHCVPEQFRRFADEVEKFQKGET